MEARRPQLDWQTLQQVRWLLGGMLSLLSAWTVFYMEVDASMLLVLTTLAVPLVTWRPSLAALWPGWIHRLAFPVVVALFAADFYQTREPLPVMIRLGLMLLLYRSVTLRTRREDLQLILLSLFLVVVAGVLTVSLVFVLQILLFTACALTLMLVITLSAAAEADGQPVAADTPTWVKVDWSVVRARLLATADWRVLALAAGLFVGVVGLSGVLFLLIPRFELGTNFFLEQMLSGKSRSGFTETVSFGDVVEIQNDRSLALSVDVTDPSKVPPEPYWRMLVLDDYMEGNFSMSSGLLAEMSAPTEKITQHLGSATLTNGTPTWTFYLEGGVSRYLPLVGNYARITFSNPQALRINRRQNLLALPLTPSKMTAYRIEGMLPESRLEDRELAQRLKDNPQAVTEARRPRLPDFEMGDYAPPPPTYLQLGLRDEDMARLKEWVEEIGPPEEGRIEPFVSRVCAWLEHRHGYSLSMSLPPGDGDLLVRWLGSPQPGHCELFAGSLVLLCRAAEVPARMVVGFKGGVWNQTSGSISVTNADAHAWVEVFDGKRHWLRADPTPGAGGLASRDSLNANAAPGSAPRMETDSGWAARWNSLRVFWYRRIVSFDQTSQLELVRSAGQMAESYGRRLITALDKRMRAFGEWVSSPWSAGRAGLLAVSCLLAGLAVWGWRKVDVASWLKTVRGADPVRREAGRWLRRMNGKGVPANDPVRADLLRLRYGRRSTWSPVAAVFRAARRTLKNWTGAGRGR